MKADCGPPFGVATRGYAVRTLVSVLLLLPAFTLSPVFAGGDDIDALIRIAIDGSDNEARRDALAKLERFGPHAKAAAAPIAKAICNEIVHFAEYYRVLASIGPYAKAECKTLFKKGTEAERAKMVGVLSRLLEHTGVEYADVFVSAMKDDSSEVRTAAVSRLALYYKLESKAKQPIAAEMIPHLIRAMEDSRGPISRSVWASEALRYAPKNLPDVFEALERTLKNKTLVSELRCNAAFALVREQNDATAIVLLTTIMKDMNEPVRLRIQVADALSGTAAPPSTGELVQIFDSIENECFELTDSLLTVLAKHPSHSKAALPVLLKVLRSRDGSRHLRSVMGIVENMGPQLNGSLAEIAKSIFGSRVPPHVSHADAIARALVAVGGRDRAAKVLMANLRSNQDAPVIENPCLMRTIEIVTNKMANTSPQQ